MFPDRGGRRSIGKTISMEKTSKSNDLKQDATRKKEKLRWTSEEIAALLSEMRLAVLRSRPGEMRHDEGAIKRNRGEEKSLESPTYCRYIAVSLARVSCESVQRYAPPLSTII